MPLMLPLDVQSLAMSLVNIESPRGDEGDLAGAIEDALGGLAHLSVERVGTTVVARTEAGHADRVIVSVRIDAPGRAEPAMAFVEMGKLFGPGASAAKGSAAVVLKAAAHGSYAHDVTFVFHGGALEETAEGAAIADASRARFALVAEPTRSAVPSADLGDPLAASLVGLTDTAPGSLAAHSDAAVWARLGVRSAAFGPGDSALAGRDDEFVPTAELGQCEYVLRTWLTT